MRRALLVEGASDLLYLQWASDRLRNAKRLGLDARWNVTPCGGIAQVPSFLALFGGNKIHVAVLTDFGAGDKRKVQEVRDSKLLRDDHVFTANQYAADKNATEADIEDILGRELYREILLKTYGLSAKQQLPKTKPTDAPQRVTLEAANHFKTLPVSVAEYGHFAPSRYLIEHGDAFDEALVASALDRFERLFVDLNALL